MNPAGYDGGKVALYEGRITEKSDWMHPTQCLE